MHVIPAGIVSAPQCSPCAHSYTYPSGWQHWIDLLSAAAAHSWDQLRERYGDLWMEPASAVLPLSCEELVC